MPRNHRTFRTLNHSDRHPGRHHPPLPPPASSIQRRQSFAYPIGSTRLADRRHLGQTPSTPASNVPSPAKSDHFGKVGLTLPQMNQPIPSAANRNTRRNPVESKRAAVNRMSKIRILEPEGALSFLGVFCISLAFMVFVWGTGYKLSLYKAEHQSSPAKLCTRGSDAEKSALDHAAGDSAVPDAALSMAVLFSLLQGTEDYSLNRLRDEAVIDLSPLSRAPILCLRPPPDEGRSLD
jgi:hypothetical protein